MNAEHIKKIVDLHYETAEDPLLLSNLGNELKKQNLWPIEGETRSLANFIKEIAPELPIIADPEAKAYVVITPKGREKLAHIAFQRRHDHLLIKKLPRAILLAFCVRAKGEVWVKITAPYHYAIECPKPDESYVSVDEKFRIPGLYVDQNRNMTPTNQDLLVSNLKNWAKEHHVELHDLTADSSAPSQAPAQAVKSAANALERLYDAQPPTLRERLVVPVDIALSLSRMR